MTTYQSRWGFHPCDYPTFRVLKRLHAWYQKALRQYAAWRRWARKLPHNRVQRRHIRNELGQKIATQIVGPWPEPPLCPVFCTEVHRLRQTQEGKPQPEPRAVQDVTFADLGIPAAYQSARRPVSDQSTVKPLPLTPEAIRRLEAEVAAWFGGKA